MMSMALASAVLGTVLLLAGIGNVAAAAYGLALLLFCLERPTIGVAVMACSLAISGSIQIGGVGSIDRAICAACSAAVLARLILDRRKIHVFDTELRPLVFLVGLAIASIVWAWDSSKAIESSATLVQLLVWSVIVRNVLWHYGGMLEVLRGYVAASLAAAAYLWATGVLSRMAYEGERVALAISHAINPADYAMYVGLAVVAAVFLAAHDPVPRLRWFWFLCVATLPGVMCLTGSRGPLMALILGAVSVLVLLSFERRLKAVTVVVCSIGLAIVVGLVWLDRDSFAVARLFDRGYRVEATTHRWGLVEQSLRMLEKRPFFGSAVGNTLVVGKISHNVHVDALFIGTELGVTAILLYIWFLVLCWRHVVSLVDSARWYAQATFVMLVVTGCGHVIVYKKPFWFFMVLVISMTQSWFTPNLERRPLRAMTA